MNLLFFSDIHISKDTTQECAEILDEIRTLVEKHHVERVFDLGDTFDKINPESECLDLFSSFVKSLDKEFIVLAANSHESTTSEDSVVNHFGILADKVQVVKEYIDEVSLYCGHFIVNESQKNKGATRHKSDLETFKYVVLGHGHSFELIKPNVCQLGSSRYVRFDEVADKKVVLLLENYKETNEKCYFIQLKSSYPMQIVSIAAKSYSVQPAQAGALLPEGVIAYLDKLPAKTKIKVLIKDFDAYKQWLTLSNTKTYAQKFAKFVVQNDFSILNQDLALISAKTETTSLKESFAKFAIERNVEDSIKKIIENEL